MSKNRRKSRRRRLAAPATEPAAAASGEGAAASSPEATSSPKQAHVEGGAGSAVPIGSGPPARHQRPACGETCGAILGLYAGLILVTVFASLAPRGQPVVGLPAPAAVLAAPVVPGAPAPRRPLARATETPEARQAVLAAVSAWLAKRAWRARQTVSSDEGSYVQSLTWVAPDRYRVYQPGIMEVVAIGDRAWRQNEGRWIEAPRVITATRTLIANLRQAPRLEQALAAGVPFEALGEEAVDGAPARVYRYQVTVEVGGLSVPTTVTWWIRNADNLPLRQVVESSFAGRPTHMELRYSYGPAINIAPPEEGLPAAGGAGEDLGGAGAGGAGAGGVGVGGLAADDEGLKGLGAGEVDGGASGPGTRGSD